jgi:metal-responsive CopG/Arc/MetJ family transcriptional regulator
MKEKLNLTLDSKLIEEIKMRAVRERRSVSEIVEELIREFLNQPEKDSGRSWTPRSGRPRATWRG